MTLQSTTTDTLEPQNPANPVNDKSLMSDTDTTQDNTVVLAHIKLTGRMLSFSRLHITGNQVDEILAKIADKLGRQRHSRLPVVVSCEQKVDLATLWDGLWQLGLQPIGVITGCLDEQALAQHIAIFPADGQRIDGKQRLSKASTDTPSPTQQAASPVASTPVPIPKDSLNIPVIAPINKVNTDKETSWHAEPSLVHQQMLRSGQSINHVGGDVVLTKGINAGAEVITDYSLHVYGKAEGRLVAGATGDKNAKIFCLRFNPSLVSVAGTYCLKENIPEEYINQAVQVSYSDAEGLVFSLLPQN